jgi:hypothetical protein
MALDAVEQKMWATTGMVFKDVENFGENRVSAFVTAGREHGARRRSPSSASSPPPSYEPCCARGFADVKFMLVHDPKLDENAMKAFFAELYELYIKVSPPWSPVRARLLRLTALCPNGIPRRARTRAQIALNPFYQKNTPIVSKAFGERVRQLMRRLL